MVYNSHHNKAKLLGYKYVGEIKRIGYFELHFLLLPFVTCINIFLINRHYELEKAWKKEYFF